MRKVTAETVYAFLRRESKSVGNTHTDGDTLYLHGNRIAWWDEGGLFATLAGWPTVTTRERLNGLSVAAYDTGYAERVKAFWQHKHVQYFDGCAIDSDSIVQIA